VLILLDFKLMAKLTKKKNDSLKKLAYVPQITQADINIYLFLCSEIRLKRLQTSQTCGWIVCHQFCQNKLQSILDSLSECHSNKLFYTKHSLYCLLIYCLWWRGLNFGLTLFLTKEVLTIEISGWGVVS